MVQLRLDNMSSIPCDLDLKNFYIFLKNCNLGHLTFEPEEIWFSNCACVFLVIRPFMLYQNFDPMTLVSVDLTLNASNLYCVRG